MWSGHTAGRGVTKAQLALTNLTNPRNENILLQQVVGLRFLEFQ